MFPRFQCARLQQPTCEAWRLEHVREEGWGIALAARLCWMYSGKALRWVALLPVLTPVLLPCHPAAVPCSWFWSRSRKPLPDPSLDGGGAAAATACQQPTRACRACRGAYKLTRFFPAALCSPPLCFCVPIGHCICLQPCLFLLCPCCCSGRPTSRVAVALNAAAVHRVSPAQHGERRGGSQERRWASDGLALQEWGEWGALKRCRRPPPAQLARQPLLAASSSLARVLRLCSAV